MAARTFGALPVGFCSAGKLIYAGSVGTGWSIKLGRSLMAALQRIAHDTPAFASIPWPETKDARWVGPQLICKVQFTKWTKEGRIRHPSFKVLREDKPVKSVRREKAVGTQ